MTASAAAAVAVAVLAPAIAVAIVAVTGHLQPRRKPPRPLVGELVVVVTPKPDAQTIRGVCTAELEDGTLVLAAAVLLEQPPASPREPDPTIVETRLGDVVVRDRAFVQLLGGRA